MDEEVRNKSTKIKSVSTMKQEIAEAQWHKTKHVRKMTWGKM